jgi:hypothetical protein
VTSLLKDYKDCSPDQSVRGVMREGSPVNVEVRWIPQREGVVKVNWDVSRNQATKCWYVGVIIQNHGFQVMMGALCGKVIPLPRGVNPRRGACIQAL